MSMCYDIAKIDLRGMMKMKKRGVTTPRVRKVKQAKEAYGRGYWV